MNYHILTAEEAQYLHEHGELLMERCGYVYHVRKVPQPCPLPGTGCYHVGNTVCPWNKENLFYVLSRYCIITRAK